MSQRDGGRRHNRHARPGRGLRRSPHNEFHLIGIRDRRDLSIVSTAETSTDASKIALKRAIRDDAPCLAIRRRIWVGIKRRYAERPGLRSSGGLENKRVRNRQLICRAVHV